MFCNDRSQSNSSSNGFNPYGGSLSTSMYFYGSSDLSCPNETDRFSTLNNKAKLKYKVGLMSYREMNLLGNNNTRKTGQSYWLISPYSYGYINHIAFAVSMSGSFSQTLISSGSGLRPVISLKPGTDYSEGNGSMEYPYVVNDESYSQH